jgi:CheY-like chemotaxis protein
MPGEILLAEDNPADVYLIRRALREHGVEHSVRVSSDGKDTLQILSREGAYRERPVLELIILDLNLPRHDGIEILERLRATEEFERVPVVVLTSSDSPRDRQSANRLGATLYLRKPTSLEQFLAMGQLFKRLLEKPAVKSQGC